MARAGLNRKTALATATVTLAAEAPDLDVLGEFKSRVFGFAHHRGFTHSFLGIALVSAVVVGLMYVIWRVRGRKLKDPNLPPRSVFEAYYSGLPGFTGFRLSTAAWGWHSETAIHVLRLVLSGALDRHPKLKLIVGHMGEGLAAMLVRFDKILTAEAPHLKRSVGQTILDHVSVTTSGLFTLPPLEALLAVFGADRVLFSIDYPYSSNRLGKDFVDSLKLPAADLEKFAHGNADRLLKLPASKAKK